ncbi:MAG: hypothetical protein OXQ93_14465 [Gemmatimonadota bacterium]|nr:hypothetical protein [Gemmatimonadota bacterium]
MKKFALPFGIPVMLALVLAGMATVTPGPVRAGTILDMPITEVPAVETTGCALQATAVPLEVTAAQATADDQDCLDAWTGARAICRVLGDESQECRDAKSAAVKVCMQDPDQD